MAKLTFQDATRLVLDEIGTAIAGAPGEQVEALLSAVLQADGVFLTGEGRSGLVARCFAMRLMHLGLRAYVVGESTTPAIREGDLLIAVSGTGGSEATCARARLAARHGARVAAVTAAEGSPLACEAAVRLVIPAGESRQYGGSQFEQGALVALEAMAVMLQERLGQSAREMDERHATVE